LICVNSARAQAVIFKASYISSRKKDKESPLSTIGALSGDLLFADRNVSALVRPALCPITWTPAWAQASGFARIPPYS
jgi:hypothetical protein